MNEDRDVSRSGDECPRSDCVTPWAWVSSKLYACMHVLATECVMASAETDGWTHDSSAVTGMVHWRGAGVTGVCRPKSGVLL